MYAEVDRLGLADNELEFAARLPDLWSWLAPAGRLPERLLVNELEPAAVALRPHIEAALAQARESGADHAMVSGSGPTVFGLFGRANVRGRLERALDGLAGRAPAAVAAEPVGRDFGAVVPADGASQ